MTQEWASVPLPVDWRPPPEPQTLEAVAFSGLNVYLRRAAGASEAELTIARDAFLAGARWAYPRGYRASARDCAVVGQVIPTLRRLGDVLESLEP